jgi:hypothetical protein
MLVCQYDRHIPESNSTFNVELVFEGDGNAVKWANQFTMISQVVVKAICLRQGIVEANLGEAVRLTRDFST